MLGLGQSVHMKRKIRITLPDLGKLDSLDLFFRHSKPLLTQLVEFLGVVEFGLDARQLAAQILNQREQSLTRC